MERVPQLVSLREAARIYYENVEIGNRQIMELFGCSKTKAQRLKAAGKEVQLREDIVNYNALYVNTDCAFRAWGLDIEDIERRIGRLRKLKLLEE